LGAKRLDTHLLSKLIKKKNKNKKYIREQISKKANRLGISSEAYLVIWAKQEGIGTGSCQRKLAPEIQAEIRDMLPTIFSSRSTPSITKTHKSIEKPEKSALTLAIEWMINDDDLLDRCKDLLKAKRNFDRVFREATTVLEDRIKRLSGIKKMKPADLISKVINPDPTKAILIVSDEAFEQQGFHNICKGLMLAFRDTTHHELSDKFQKQDALVFCGFVNSILTILGNAKKQEVT